MPRKKKMPDPWTRLGKQHYANLDYREGVTTYIRDLCGVRLQVALGNGKCKITAWPIAGDGFLIRETLDDLGDVPFSQDYALECLQEWLEESLAAVKDRRAAEVPPPPPAQLDGRSRVVELEETRDG